jgi:hypothetical protein
MKMLAGLFLGLYATTAVADPTMVCEYGGTMILTVPREEYTEEPDSIFKLVVWNGQTMGERGEPDVCPIDYYATVIYDHSVNTALVNGKIVEYADTYDLVTVIPGGGYSISESEAKIEENTRAIFYIYEQLLY